MISKKFTIYTKSQKLIFKILDTIQVIFGLSITGLIVWAMLVTQNSITFWTIIMGIAAIISLVDIVIRKTFNKQSIFHLLLLKLYKSNIALFPPTPMQTEVSSWITTRIRNGNGILIYGKPNTGKNSSVFMFLSKETKDIELLRNISRAESIIYIDCKNNKSDIFNFFNVAGKSVNKKLYENSLIILKKIYLLHHTRSHQ